MSVLFIAVPAALAFAVSAVIAFLWTARSGQLDDLETPPLRMLQDETRSAPSGGRGVSDVACPAPRNEGTLRP
jgi:cbb3-type cytochrome oxidase maturation protein